ncbi:MAG: aminotransferase class V-fold PLP-dependent enzyme [Bacteroidia bacterium]|nr:MAG: aminotransferase class V-fold PLP-dependent enzyme [Bacteroidia bacterium]
MSENHFLPFRNNIIGIDQTFPTPFGEKKMIYADWIASGRLYGPIEKTLLEKVFPFCGNTHTETSAVGTMMTLAYNESKEYIKKQVNAGPSDAIVFSGSGMTDSINKLQRILGLRIPDAASQHISNFKTKIQLNDEERPIVLVTHMEHHSNHTSWLETIADVEIIEPDLEGNTDLNHLEFLLKKFQNRKLKIASITAASNVTGVITPYYSIAQLMHQAGGLCFVDFACSGPYVTIDMHPDDEDKRLDVVFISPHKFLGGPATPGVMVMNTSLCKNEIPDHAGGGTVKFTTPWKTHEYYANVEQREDGGTPAFLQGIKAALVFKLKSEMGVQHILQRESEILKTVFDKLKQIKNLHILAGNIEHRIGSVSFYIENLHFNLGVKLLNDYFGIQVRGGCACAGTYGHYLLNIGQEESKKILENINQGNLSARPGWIRLSIHPTMTEAEIKFILDSIEYVAANHTQMSQDYKYVNHKNIFVHKHYQSQYESNFVHSLFYNT